MPIARPKHWWIIVGQGIEVGFTWLRIFSSTDVPDHLYIAWATWPPTQREIWKVVRGVRIFCGIKYIWDTPNICEQAEEGDTLIHRFFISGIPTMSRIWWYLNAPGGPYGLEIQGPLQTTDLLKLPAWSTRAYFASKLMGMFKTDDLSGPGGPQPTWIPDSDGLEFLDISQATPDPWDPYHRRFVISHGDAYRMDNIFIEDPATATLILSQEQAVVLAGGAPGGIAWIAGNMNHPGHFYVLFICELTGPGVWCIKTEDYGETWTAHQITPTIFNYRAGNIQAGTCQGESPHEPGDVIYAALNLYAGGNLWLFRSVDEADTWHTCPSQPPSASVWTPRLHVDPADQGHVYTGVVYPTLDLWRTLDHGETWAVCDDGNELPIAILPATYLATMKTRLSNPDEIRVLRGSHIWKTSDGGLIWRDQAHTQFDVGQMHYRDSAPDFLYLARTASAPLPDGLYREHVFFVSTDDGSTMFGKAGEHAEWPAGAGDSIPRLCGGAAEEGILTLPWP
ncbi:hypothetical protein ES708_11477 [subsurface metagenome]